MLRLVKYSFETINFDRGSKKLAFIYKELCMNLKRTFYFLTSNCYKFLDIIV